MLINSPPMGWNSWNTFGEKINEDLIKETADAMVSLGYRDAGYKYVVIDDGWMTRERDEKGNFVVDPKKFPNGMKALADYIHEKGLLFGIYSAAGVRTCLGLPGSYGHEYQDAEMFAKWGVDFLKYDLCHFPGAGNQKLAYLTMAQALRASGRDILFAAANCGEKNPGTWMKSIGAHMYRSTGDIYDKFESFRDIAVGQVNNLCMSGPGCYNDPDMLVIGMYGAGNVSRDEGGCTDEEYRIHFALWCLFSVPLMIGGDVRKINDFCRVLLQNKELIALDQDAEGRPPYFERNARYSNEERMGFIKLMDNNECLLGYFNFAPYDFEVNIYFDDAGVPSSSGYGIELTDIFTGECIGVKKDYYCPKLPTHSCKLYKGKIVKL